MYELNVRYEKDVEKSNKLHKSKSEPSISRAYRADSSDSSSSSLFYESDEDLSGSCDDYDESEANEINKMDAFGLNKRVFDVYTIYLTFNSNRFLYIFQQQQNFNKFEWIRMAHTIALLNLALLAIKSEILITDLVRSVVHQSCLKKKFLGLSIIFLFFRFIYQRRLSYFNIDEILPQSMKFSYSEDAKIFNRMVSVFELLVTYNQKRIANIFLFF